MKVLDLSFWRHFQIPAEKLSATSLGSQRNADTINETMPALRH